MADRDTIHSQRGEEMSRLTDLQPCAKCGEDGDLCCEFCKKVYCEDHCQIIETCWDCPSGDNWISVDDEMPKPGKYVWIQFGTRGMAYVASYWKDTEENRKRRARTIELSKSFGRIPLKCSGKLPAWVEHSEGIDFQPEEIKYWQPLPEPRTEE